MMQNTSGFHKVLCTLVLECYGSILNGVECERTPSNWVWSKNESGTDASSNFVVNDQSWRIETVTSFLTTSFEIQILKVIEIRQAYEFFWVMYVRYK